MYSEAFLQKCLAPLKEHFQPKIRVIIWIPDCTLHDDHVDYQKGKKHLVVLNRLIYRSAKGFLDYLVNRF